MKKEKAKTYFFMLIQICVVILGTIAIILQIFQSVKNDNGVNKNGWDVFKFFTNDGNIFCILSSLIALIDMICMILKKENKQNKIVYFFQLASANSALIIFLVVVCLLVPHNGTGLLQGYSMVILHVVNPILIVLSYLFLTPKNNKISIKEMPIGSFPVIVYGIIATILCLFHIWEGKNIPYFFLDVYSNPWWLSILFFIGIIGGSIIFSFFLTRLQYLFHK